MIFDPATALMPDSSHFTRHCRRVETGVVLTGVVLTGVGVKQTLTLVVKGKRTVDSNRFFGFLRLGH